MAGVMTMRSGNGRPLEKDRARPHSEFTADVSDLRNRRRTYERTGQLLPTC